MIRLDILGKDTSFFEIYNMYKVIIKGYITDN